MAKKMSELKTEELTEILKQTTDIDVFLDDNELLPNVSLAEYINELVEEKKTKIADVARKAHMSSSYLYKLGEGKRKSPTRNKALQICFGLGLDIDESNELLKLAGVGVLYSKIARDSIIMFCLEMAGAAPEITITMPCLANNELLDGTVWFTLLQGEDIFMEIWILGLLVSLLFIALSKEKVEDEMILQIRLQSMLHALWITSLCFVLETLFLFGFAYAYSLWATLYIFLLFFILKFRYELYQLKKAEK